MVQLKWLLVLVWILTAVQPGFADDRAKIAGSWKIVSWEGEFQATGEVGCTQVVTCQEWQSGIRSHDHREH